MPSAVRNFSLIPLMISLGIHSHDACISQKILNAESKDYWIKYLRGCLFAQITSSICTLSSVFSQTVSTDVTCTGIMEVKGNIAWCCILRF